MRLADLGVAAIKAKIDTGARTSALHAFAIEPFRRSGALWVRFEVHPLQRSSSVKIKCEAKAVDERAVRNSGGLVERRYIIQTRLMLGDRAWPIELALANRDQMGFRMLLGRTALEGRALIEPGRSFSPGIGRRACANGSHGSRLSQARRCPRPLSPEETGTLNEDRVARAQSASL